MTRPSPNLAQLRAAQAAIVFEKRRQMMLVAGPGRAELMRMMSRDEWAIMDGKGPKISKRNLKWQDRREQRI